MGVSFVLLGLVALHTVLPILVEHKYVRALLVIVVDARGIDVPSTNQYTG